MNIESIYNIYGCVHKRIEKIIKWKIIPKYCEEYEAWTYRYYLGKPYLIYWRLSSQHIQ